MTELWRQLADNRTQIQTRRALLLVDLQNDFLEPSGKCPLIVPPEFGEKIKRVVRGARERNTVIVWVRTEIDPDRVGSDEDAEDSIFLDQVDEPQVPDWLDDVAAKDKNVKSQDLCDAGMVSESAARKKRGKRRVKTMGLLKKMASRKELPMLSDAMNLPSPSTRDVTSSDRNSLTQEAASSPAVDEDYFLSPKRSTGPCCVQETPGADSSTETMNLADMDMDTMITKHSYSGFSDTQLLVYLRMQLITELFICGCGTNTGIYATVVDAVRHGFHVNLISDCVGYRSRARHETALRVMSEEMGATVITSTEFELGREESTSAVRTVESTPQAGMPVMDECHDHTQTISGLNSMSSLTSALNESIRYRSNHLEALTFSEDDEDDDDAFTGEIELGNLRAESSPRTGRSDATTLENNSPRPVTSKDARSHATRSQAAGDVRVAGTRSASKEAELLRSQSAGSGSTQPPHELNDLILSDRRAPTQYVSQFLDATSKNNGLKAATAVSSHPVSPQSSPSWTEAKNQASAQNAYEPKSRHQADHMSTSQTSSAVVKDVREKRRRPLDLSNMPFLGPSDTIGDGDSRIVYNFFPADDPSPSNIFTTLHEEVQWEKMHHNEGEVPRLVAVQGEIDPSDGSFPIYRHPSDQSPPVLPFSDAVSRIRRQAEQIVGHDLNHALIQLYRTGEDNISEHSDKTLDIVHGSSIVNVSFGAQRTMRLRTKRPLPDDSSQSNASSSTPDPSTRITQRIPMPHNSIFILGPNTNGNWVHGIQPDKRRSQERSESELAFDGMRISLTFRQIGTFLDGDAKKIWGQGAVGKVKEDARSVVCGDEVETRKLIDGFGKENREGYGGWREWYGIGTDVLHFRVG